LRTNPKWVNKEEKQGNQRNPRKTRPKHLQERKKQQLRKRNTKPKYLNKGKARLKHLSKGKSEKTAD
jgi:hypothetical protein